MKKSFWCTSCCCQGHGCSSDMSPCCWSMQKSFCCHGQTTSGEECCGPLGICSNLNKFCCCIGHSQFPPDPLMCAICNCFIIGKPPTAPMVMNAEQASNIAFLQNTFWCYYCCCQGEGCVG